MSRKSNQLQRRFYSILIGCVFGPYLIFLLFFLFFATDRSLWGLVIGTLTVYPILFLVTLPLFLLSKWIFKVYPILYNRLFPRLILTVAILIVLTPLVVFGYQLIFEQMNQQKFLTYTKLAVPVSTSVLVAVSFDFLVNQYFLRRTGNRQM
ncbi:MAG: hypothetical protein A3D31_16870 [Candidatus Fluviicola riflensis]|nr:MAG: hypothetical protein CHH17_01810 [Candidatus Fluviicola riflensis]OGS76665.1 MAG: hypothetical protein A3D31_16870 [Candidatus Fluviicola riflensis]OGS82980.1 MAG: hypothetical protein A2724_14490 [Fluviicola sp. RIFCSPHIGHO2_01_FULL_43_53]OGS88396.1 MAG: hypothetical protein A3E30_06375 [Fluviicola sp. RIFCSPHIGHO2_12_FULL_43_24]